LTQFQQALDDGHLPFLNSLLKKERYVLHPFYSGVPSNTPAVQGELFYGVKTCVPAFSFVDRKTKEPIKMSDTPYVASLEAYLKTQGKGLLAGGSSYSNIFAGGAEEAHCCWGKMGWQGIWHAINPLVLPFLIILYIDIFIRTFLLLVVEGIIAAFECVKGTFKGRLFAKEFEIVWLRVLICVFLREFIVAGASMDIMRGLPIIHLNLLGYDEQAHARGPSSRFAHWSLQGVDDAIRRIDQIIKQSPYRDYNLWVYSDHGQERTVPYLVKYGYTVEDAVAKIFMDPAVVVTAMGPMGHIYTQNKFLAWTKRGQFILPDEGSKVFGDDHPFLEEVGEDVLRACHHPNAGEFIILGWCNGEMPISFPREYGAHAGVGKEETKGFALLPSDVYIEPNGKNYLRPMSLRNAAINFLSQQSFFHYVHADSSLASVKTLRMMSYNVHGCKGMDGRVSTDRIARVIARYNPDIVALQELDVRLIKRSGLPRS
jgi:hypothetical protein